MAADDDVLDEAEYLSPVEKLALCIYASAERVHPTRLQKLSLLVGDLLGLRRELEPEPYHFGPFSEAVTDAEEELRQGGLVRAKDRSITGYGTAVLKAVESIEDRWKSAMDIIHNFDDLSDGELTSLVYDLYPEHTSKSTILDTVTDRRHYEHEVVGVPRDVKEVTIDIDGQRVKLVLPGGRRRSGTSA